MYDLFQRTVKTQAVTIRGEIIGYEICLPKVETLVYVVGCYRAATGGADTIKPLSLVFAAIEERLCMGQHVIYEGSFVMNQTKGPELAAELTDRLTVMLLTTPLATCKQSVNERRALRGAGKLPNTEHIESNFKRAHSYAAKMQAAGARLVRVSRAEALPKLMGLLHDA